MITLRKLAHLFISDVSGGDQSKDSQIDEREVMLKIRQLMAEVLFLKQFEKLNSGDRSPITQYVASYDLSVADGDDFQTSTLPEFYVGLPNNRGVHRVFEKDNPRNDFLPMRNPAVTQSLETARIKGLNYYYVEGLTIVYPRLNNSITDVTVQLIIPAPDTITKDANLPILPEHQSQILRMLKEDYAYVPKDYLNDNNNEV